MSRDHQDACSAGDSGRELARAWSVWRQDDHGNEFEVSSGHTREEAEEIVAVFEQRGHKQRYWVARSNSS